MEVPKAAYRRIELLHDVVVVTESRGRIYFQSSSAAAVMPATVYVVSSSTKALQGSPLPPGVPPHIHLITHQIYLFYFNHTVDHIVRGLHSSLG